MKNFKTKIKEKSSSKNIRIAIYSTDQITIKNIIKKTLELCRKTLLSAIKFDFGN